MKRPRKGAGGADAEEETDAVPAFVPAGDPATGGRFQIDGVRGLQAIALGIAVADFVWIILRYIVHAI